MIKKQRSLHTIPHVGVAVVILQQNKMLLGRRLNQPMRDSWQLPGGWIHLGETPEQAVERQINGFQGLHCSAPEFITYTNNVFDQNTHSLSLYFKARCLNTAPFSLPDTDQCSDWYWADWYDLPQPLFLPLRLLKESGFMPLL